MEAIFVRNWPKGITDAKIPNTVKKTTTSWHREIYKKD